MFRPHTAILSYRILSSRSLLLCYANFRLCNVARHVLLLMLSVNYVILCFVSNFVMKLLYLCVYTCGINYCVVELTC
jgi:hypothetical protein